MSGETCGVAAHEEECLCDVKITKRVGFMPDASLMWGGNQIKRALAKGMPTLEVLERLVKAHDLWRQEQQLEVVWAEGKAEAVKVALAEGQTIVQALADNEVTPLQFVHIVQPGCDVSAEALSMTALLDIQMHGQSGGTARAMERKYNLQKRFVRNCFEIMNIKPDQRKCSPSDKLTIEQRRSVVAMVMTGQHSHGEMVSYCYQTYGVSLDRTYFSKLRARENERLSKARQKRKAQ